MEITRTSIASNITRTKELNITEEELKRIAAGEHIQDVLYHLSDDDREFILTGMISEEWDELFK